VLAFQRYTLRNKKRKFEIPDRDGGKASKKREDSTKSGNVGSYVIVAVVATAVAALQTNSALCPQKITPVNYHY